MLWRHKTPRHLDESVVFKYVGSRKKVTRTTYFTVLDTFVVELGNCFDDKNLIYMCSGLGKRVTWEVT